MFKRFIERPVLSTVVSIILTLLGLLSLYTLPITLFPDIAPPTVQVTASYPGANAEVVARAVATPLEEAINGVEDMTYMTSTSSNDGTMAQNAAGVGHHSRCSREQGRPGRCRRLGDQNLARLEPLCVSQ